MLKWMTTMASDAISFFRIGRDGLTVEMRLGSWMQLLASLSATASGGKCSCKWNATEAACWSVSWAPGNSLIMIIDGVGDVTERGALAAEAFQAPRPRVVHLFLAPRRRYVTRVDIAVHGKNRKTVHKTRSAGQGLEEQMEHDPQGQGSFASTHTQSRCGS